MTSGRKIQIKNFTVKGAVLKPDEKRFDVSKQLRRKAGGSKKVRVVRKGSVR